MAGSKDALHKLLELLIIWGRGEFIIALSLALLLFTVRETKVAMKYAM